MAIFYVIKHISRKHFVSLQRYKIANEIFMLQYQIKRYQAMGNGTMCQTLNGKLQKLLAKQSLVTM